MNLQLDFVVPKSRYASKIHPCSQIVWSSMNVATPSASVAPSVRSHMAWTAGGRSASSLSPSSCL